METKKSSSSVAFKGAAWFVLLLGVCLYIIGLFNAEMQLNEKGYYFTLLLFGLFAAVSIQKSVRDRLEGIPVTTIYYNLAWFSILADITLLVIGLVNADLALSEKGFYGTTFVLSLFGAVVVQKNTRDEESEKEEKGSGKSRSTTDED